MEFVKITFPTKEDIASTVYDSIAVAVDSIPAVPVPEVSATFTEQMSSLWSLGEGMVTTISTRPVHFRKIPLEEWSSGLPSDEKP